MYPNTLVQITVAESKPSLDEGLLELHLACLPDRPEYFLDYVVPHDVYDTFKVPRLNRSGSFGVRVQRTHVRVVKVAAAATSPCLQRSRMTLHPTALSTRSGPMASRFGAVV